MTNKSRAQKQFPMRISTKVKIKQQQIKREFMVEGVELAKAEEKTGVKDICKER